MSLSIMGSVNTYTKTMKLQTQWNLKQQSGDYTSHKKSLDEWISTAQETLKKSRRGNFKIYIGMIAGVGKTYRMLQEAHELLRSGIDVQVGYVETHGRVETEALVEGLPLIPRRRSFYKGKEVEEMDL